MLMDILPKKRDCPAPSLARTIMFRINVAEPDVTSNVLFMVAGRFAPFNKGGGRKKNSLIS